MAFMDYREPIEYVVDKYLAKKAFYESNARSDHDGAVMRRGEYSSYDLPNVPCRILRDSKNRAYKFIYGDLSLLEGGGEADPVIWQEELIRDASGKVVQIVTTYPDGEITVTELVRDGGGKVSEYKFAGNNL